ncbi:hypothetical protein IJG98_03550 [Candidatus Saccharibacteria bacterium]|nr:hypothetical protein [Candidatus Saccharibacteria bacterium]
MKIFNKVSLITLVAVTIGSIFTNQNVFADDAVKTGIQLAPASQRMTLDPGAHYDGTVTITNTGTTDIGYSVSVSPYQVDEKYSPVFTRENTYTQISRWITLEETTGSIGAGQVQVLNYVIDVPYDAPGGSQYAAIFVTTTDVVGAQETVRADASAGVVVLARVNGETRETGEITSVSVPSFILSPPLTATVRATNTGNVDEDVRTTIEVRNSLTGAVLYDNSADPDVNTLLPDTERTMTFVVNDIPRLGVLSFSITNEYVDDAQIKTATVIVCPLWFIAIIVLIILTIVFRILAKKRDDRRTRANSRNSTGSADKFNI